MAGKSNEVSEWRSSSACGTWLSVGVKNGDGFGFAPKLGAFACTWDAADSARLRFADGDTASGYRVLLWAPCCGGGGDAWGADE